MRGLQLLCEAKVLLLQRIVRLRRLVLVPLRLLSRQGCGAFGLGVRSLLDLLLLRPSQSPDRRRDGRLFRLALDVWQM